MFGRKARRDGGIPDPLARLEAFHEAVQACPDLLSIHDVGGRYVYASSGAWRVLGRSPDELVGCDPFSLLHPDDLNEVQKGHDGVVASADAYVVRYRAKRADGSWVWLETTSRTVREDGRPVRILAWTRVAPAGIAKAARVFTASGWTRVQE